MRYGPQRETDQKLFSVGVGCPVGFAERKSDPRGRMRRAPEAAPVPSLLPSHIDHCLLNTHHLRRHIPSIFPPRLQALPHTAPLPKHHHHLLPTPPTPLSQPPSHITSHITSHSVSSKRKNCFQAARPPGPTPGAPVRRGAHWYPASHLSIQKKIKIPQHQKIPHTHPANAPPPQPRRLPCLSNIHTKNSDKKT